MEHILSGTSILDDKNIQGVRVKNIFWKIILIYLAIFLVGCSKSKTEKNNYTETTNVINNNPSCLVEDAHTAEIVMCFEGDLEYVKSKCVSKNNKYQSKITFSTNGGCPKDRGYIGYCIYDEGEYIPFSYIHKSKYLTPEKEEIMKKIAKENCIRFRGEWKDKTEK